MTVLEDLYEPKSFSEWWHGNRDATHDDINENLSKHIHRYSDMDELIMKLREAHENSVLRELTDGMFKEAADRIESLEGSLIAADECIDHLSETIRRLRNDKSNEK